MNALIMLKSAPSWASLRLRERLTRDSSTAQPEPVGARRLAWSSLAPLDVLGPKIEPGMKSKYQESIKVRRRAPRSKHSNQMFSLTDPMLCDKLKRGCRFCFQNKDGKQGEVRRTWIKRETTLHVYTGDGCLFLEISQLLRRMET